MGKFSISVIIPTYNPKIFNFERTLAGLANQTLSQAEWECVIVDNASTNDALAQINFQGLSNLRIVLENRPGLTFARIRGFEESSGDLMVFVDDDNILSETYLHGCIVAFKKHQNLGVAGGRSVGAFENAPEPWMESYYSLIAVRPEILPETLTSDLRNGYPVISPIGAGMAVSRKCFRCYAEYITNNTSVTTDRVGRNLSSGGDNEINIIALKSGFQTGYFPELVLTHLIDKGRLEAKYLRRLNYASNRSWVKLLHGHQMSPWKPISKIGLIPRWLKALLIYKPWKSKANSIQYAGVCGMYKGLSEIT